MTLRDKAAALEAPPTLGVIDRLLADHEDRKDEILDLLVGVPLLPARVVAKTLCDEFSVQMSATPVQRWRQRQ